MGYREVKQTVNNVRTPSYSFSEIHKLIPANEATEKKGQRQLASRTAVEDDEEVAGEDTKIKRPKAEKVKDFEMSSSKPFDAKIKKQLADLKALIKGTKDIEATDGHTMDDVDTAGLLSEQQERETETSHPLYQPEKTDIEKPSQDVEATTLGEAIGIERPRIK